MRALLAHFDRAARARLKDVNNAGDGGSRGVALAWPQTCVPALLKRYRF